MSDDRSIVPAKDDALARIPPPLVGIRMTEPPADKYTAQTIFFCAWRWRNVLTNIFSQLEEYPEGARTMLLIDGQGKRVALPALPHNGELSAEQMRWLAAARKTAEWYWDFFGRGHGLGDIPSEIYEEFATYWAQLNALRALPAPEEEA